MLNFCSIAEKFYYLQVDNLISDVYVEIDENDYAMKKNEERAFVEDDGKLIILIYSFYKL